MYGVHVSRYTGLCMSVRMRRSQVLRHLVLLSSCMGLLHAHLHLFLVLNLSRSSHLEFLGRFARFQPFW
ncbi:hypothetical protein YC2023_108944 [Brassica napus]